MGHATGRVKHDGTDGAGETTDGVVTIVWHNGATGGYSSFIGFDPEREVGVVLLANQTSGYDDIAQHLLDPTLPLTLADAD